ncbi:MAG: FAD-dependent monooxygenase, partial [Actinomycetota bacterium]|nr:FAD-dependent monooxygenase [Actinomycetota bacterium]
MLDLAVVGGGPVGLATAAFAARAGLEAVVFEPRTGVIDKACGEGLMPGAVSLLSGVGVEPEGMPFRGIRYLRGSIYAEASFRAGTGLGVRRTTLHAALRERVDAEHVPVISEAVTQLYQRHDSVAVNGVRVRYVVAADGLHSSIRRSLGLELPARGPRRFGLSAHAEMQPWTDNVEVHWADAAEAYVTPVAPDCVGIALLTSARGGFGDHLRRFPELHARLDGIAVSPALGAGPLRQRSHRRSAGRVLLAGDASGYVDALTGEGIALGVRQARAAVAAVAADDPAQYERAWRHITRRYQALTHTLLAGTRFTPSRRALVPAAAALP